MKTQNHDRIAMIWGFIWKRHRAAFLIGFISFLLSWLFITAISLQSGNFPRECWSWSYWEPITGMTVLVVAVLLWFGEASQDSKNALPKKVTAVFLYPGSQDSSAQGELIAILCEKAYLAGEDDLRNWSQQLGAQISGDGRLKFSPFIRQYPGRIESDDKGDLYKHY